MNVLVRLKLIIVVLLAMDKELPLQVESFFSFFSCKGVQSLMCSLEGLAGTPKYLMGNSPDWQLKRSI